MSGPEIRWFQERIDALEELVRDGRETLERWGRDGITVDCFCRAETLRVFENALEGVWTLDAKSEEHVRSHSYAKPPRMNGRKALHNAEVLRIYREAKSKGLSASAEIADFFWIVEGKRPSPKTVELWIRNAVPDDEKGWPRRQPPTDGDQS